MLPLLFACWFFPANGRDLALAVEPDAARRQHRRHFLGPGFRFCLLDRLHTRSFGQLREPAHSGPPPSGRLPGDDLGPASGRTYIASQLGPWRGFSLRSLAERGRASLVVAQLLQGFLAAGVHIVAGFLAALSHPRWPQFTISPAA